MLIFWSVSRFSLLAVIVCSTLWPVRLNVFFWLLAVVGLGSSLGVYDFGFIHDFGFMER